MGASAVPFDPVISGVHREHHAYGRQLGQVFPRIGVSSTATMPSSKTVYRTVQKDMAVVSRVNSAMISHAPAEGRSLTGFSPYLGPIRQIAAPVIIRHGPPEGRLRTHPSRHTGELHLHLQLRIGVRLVQFRADSEIIDVLRRLRDQKHLPKNAGQTPEVLVLQPTGVASAVDLDGQLFSP